MEERWSDHLPSKYLDLLARDVESKYEKTNNTLAYLQKQMLDAEFQFRGCGFVVNEINMVTPKISVNQVICQSPVTAYFLKRSAVESLIRKFSFRFINLECKVWKKLLLHHYKNYPSNIREEMLLYGSFASLNPNEMTREIYPVDPKYFERAILLEGFAYSNASPEMLHGPCEYPEGTTLVTFPRGGIKSYLIPVNANASVELLKLECKRLLKMKNFNSETLEEIIIHGCRILFAQDMSPQQIVTTPIYLGFKLRIKQVIGDCYANEGEIVTAEDVILDQGFLDKDGEQDDQKYLAQQIKKIDDMMAIPYDGGKNKVKLNRGIPGLS